MWLHLISLLVLLKGARVCYRFVVGTFDSHIAGTIQENHNQRLNINKDIIKRVLNKQKESKYTHYSRLEIRTERNK